ncbi:MAG: hypothetical protein AB7K09_12165 [Planctomycetota bacterium]
MTAACTLLPDLLGYAGATRPTHRVPDADECRDSPVWAAVRTGMRHHIEVDRVFHSCDWFEQRMQASGQWLRDRQSPLREHWSLWVLRHVTIELVIDRQLLVEDDALPGRVYVGLEALAADRAAVAALEARFGGSLQRYLDEFLARQWLHHYRDETNLPHVLSRIFGRLLTRKPRIREVYGDTETFTAAEEAALPGFIDAVIEQVADAGLPPIVVPVASE